MKTTYWFRETYPGENVILSYFFCFFKKGAGCCITIQKIYIYIYIYKLVYPKSFWNAKIEIGRVPHEVPQYLRLFIMYQKFSQSLGGGVAGVTFFWKKKNHIEAIHISRGDLPWGKCSFKLFLLLL